jgi:2-polyprenyl-6-methoxyphenol hydroxylase-like FAD-dependent oxidoreductase
MEPSTKTPAHFASEKRIIIAGAGIAGLAFTRALDRYWPSGSPRPRITIYERDTQEVSVEREGYSLSIRSDGASGGMQALQKLGLLDSMLEMSITGLQGQKGTFMLWDVNWKPILKFKSPSQPPDGLPAPHMRIARNVLRRLLVEGLPSYAEVHWSSACRGVQRLPDGRVQVELSDGQVDDCDILVIADGANSKLRAVLRPDDKLCFAGAVCLSGSAKFTDGVPEPVDENWGLLLGGGGTSLFASPIDEDRAVWCLSYLSPERREIVKPPLLRGTVDELLKETLVRGKVFEQPFEQLVQATDPSTFMLFNAMDKQPFVHSDIGSTPIIFIGDSNHAMSPFAGNGANMALMDGVELAEEVCKGVSLKSAVEKYDARSMPRSKRAIRQSHWVINVAHAEGLRLAFWMVVLRIFNFLMRMKG